MKHLLLPFLFAFPQLVEAQLYTSYLTGDTTDVLPVPQGGLCLMGGSSEDDNAMRWFLQRASGGDVVVIRAAGADGYNDYFFTDLGVAVNSVETIVMPSAAAALDPYVVQQIRRAEALWIAGGDQWDYVSFWKNKPVGEAIRYLIHEKKAVVGGTSAGMAIMGEAYFDAKNGTIVSAEALANPFDAKLSLGYADFLDHPHLKNTITDTHFDDPDRKGRLMTFLARLTQAEGHRFFGIACDIYTAVCIDTQGVARVFGTTADDDNAYFVQVNCVEPFLPETCEPGQKLNWQRNKEAVKTYKVKGKSDGSGTFDLRDWKTGSGGIWQNWWVENGAIKTFSGATLPDCTSAAQDVFEAAQLAIRPNPVGDFLQIELPNDGPHSLQIIDTQGKTWLTEPNFQPGKTLDVSHLPSGAYWVRCEGSAAFGRFMKQ